LAGAILEAAGSGVAGLQKKGISAQYQLDGVNGTAESALGGVHPYDSGNILGHTQPGKTGEKLVRGTVQRATSLLSTRAVGSSGNALVSSNLTGGWSDPTPPLGSQSANGLSLAPEHE
jgi:hypothetical protein